MLIVKELEDSRQLLFEMADSLRPSLENESVELADALGRVLASPVASASDVPAFRRSMVDGYAVRAGDTFGASESMPAMLTFDGEVAMGSPAGAPLRPGACRAVPTGGQIPDGADAMVMVEDTDDFGDGLRYIYRPASPGSHLVFIGDDIRAGEVLLPSGLKLEPRHLAAAAAAGHGRVTVRRPVRVAVLSTGDELVSPGFPLRAGQIHDVNQVMLLSVIRRAGAVPVPFGIIPDDQNLLRDAVKRAMDTCDMVVLSGGSSVGARDHVAAAITAAGEPGILQHGIAVKPGKPTLIGLCGHTPFIGLPGHPAAAWFMADRLLVPFLFRLQGLPEPCLKTVQARLGSRIPSNQGREEFVLARLSDAGYVDSADPVGYADSAFSPGDTKKPDRIPLAEPVFSKSGLIRELAACDGYIRIPRDCEGLEAGSIVQVILMSPDGAKGVE